MNPLRERFEPTAAVLAKERICASATEAMQLPLGDFFRWTVRLEERFENERRALEDAYS